MKYHHMGIPTQEKKPGERYLPEFGMYVSGYEESPYNIEWMRFETNSPLPDLVQTIPHIAFEVTDLEKELVGKNVIIPPNAPSDGVRVAFIEDHGTPVEFIQYIQSKRKS